MCYFDHQLWPCGWWKWGHFRQQCTREYRTGETCGLKLVFNTYLEPKPCRHCEQMLTKRGRVEKMELDVRRWRAEGNRRATIEKTEKEIYALNMQIAALWGEHEVRRRSINY